MGKKRFFLLTFMLMVVLAACSNMQAQPADDPLVYEPTQPSISITATEAEDLAIDLIGGGELISLELSTHEGNQLFEIIIDFEDFLYEVLVDLQRGDVIRLSSNRPSATEEEMR